MKSFQKNMKRSSKLEFEIVFYCKLPYETQLVFLSPFAYYEHSIGSFGGVKCNFELLFL